jgi:hypothetical protein
MFEAAPAYDERSTGCTGSRGAATFVWAGAGLGGSNGILWQLRVTAVRNTGTRRIGEDRMQLVGAIPGLPTETQMHIATNAPAGGVVHAPLGTHDSLVAPSKRTPRATIYDHVGHGMTSQHTWDSPALVPQRPGYPANAKKRSVVSASRPVTRREHSKALRSAQAGS